MSTRPCLAILAASAELYGSDKALLRVLEVVGSEADIDLFLPFDGPMRARAEETGVRVRVVDDYVLRRRCLRPQPFVRWHRAVKGVVGALTSQHDRRPYDRVIANGFGAGWPLRWAQQRGIRTQLYAHEIFARRLENELLCRFIAFAADQIVCCSQAVLEGIARVLPRQRLTVLAHGMPLPPSPKRTAGSGEGPLQMGCVGRLHPWKGQGLLLDALRLLPPSAREQCHLRLVGGTFAGYEWVEEHLRKQTRDLGLAGMVTFVPFTEAIDAIWQDLDVAIVPSTQPDPMPLVVLEAMSWERPVLGAAHGGIPEMIEDAKTGRLFEPGDAGDLAEKIIWCLKHRTALPELGRAGRAKVAGSFGMASFRQRVKAIFLP